MKSILTIVAVAVAASYLGLANAANKAGHKNDEQSIIQIENEMLAGILKGDTAALERYFADNLVFTDPDGVVQGKDRVIGDIKSGDLKFESSKLDDMKVQVYRDTAVATYVSTDKGSYKGKPFSGRTRWTDVFVTRGGQPQIVASQGTHVAEH